MAAHRPFRIYSLVVGTMAWVVIIAAMSIADIVSHHRQGATACSYDGCGPQ